MRSEFNDIQGRVGVAAMIVLALAALALYLYSERAVPPESEVPDSSGVELQSETDRTDAAEPSAARGSGRDRNSAGVGSDEALDSPFERPRSTEPQDFPNTEVALEQEQQRLREDLAARLGPGQVEMIVEEQLLERLVTTINSLDGDPVPLRFRPLDHVPGLPRLEGEDEDRRLPGEVDPRYRPYRALFDRFEAVELAELFDRYEPAIEQSWQALGEHSGQSFRARLIEVLEHLADFEVPPERPAVHRPKVLYEYIDPELEQLSWGRKALIRIGPENASEVQRKLAELARQLARREGGADQDENR